MTCQMFFLSSLDSPIEGGKCVLYNELCFLEKDHYQLGQNERDITTSSVAVFVVFVATAVGGVRIGIREGGLERGLVCFILFSKTQCVISSVDFVSPIK